MLVFKIALIGIAGAMLAMVTKQFKPEYSTLVLLAVCLFLIGYLTSNLKEVLNFVQTLQKRIPISSMYIKILLKVFILFLFIIVTWFSLRNIPVLIFIILGIFNLCYISEGYLV